MSDHGLDALRYFSRDANRWGSLPSGEWASSGSLSFGIEPLFSTPLYDEHALTGEAFPEPIVCVHCATQFHRNEPCCIACGAPAGRSLENV